MTRGGREWQQWGMGAAIARVPRRLCTIALPVALVAGAVDGSATWEPPPAPC